MTLTHGRIAYIMSRFPHLPETFILREMDELERQGWQPTPFPLILQRQPVVHSEARPWIPRAQRLPFISGAVVLANASEFAANPVRYAAVWARMVRDNASSPYLLLRALALFPQAVYAARRMRELGTEHIHAHYATHPALAAWIIHAFTGIPYSITVHAHDIFVRTAMLETKVRDAGFIVAISEFNREYLAGQLGDWVRAKTQVIHCGIDPDRFPPRPHPVGGRFEILNIGSLQPYKGQAWLVHACALLRDRHIPFHCRIIGGGEEFDRLKQLVSERGLTEQVELMGAQPQERVAEILPTAHCYVQPSIITPSRKMEGIPVALMEALACELPVIATRLSGVPELVRDRETGLLVEPQDSQALADALTEVYAYPDRAAVRARAGRELVLREFNLHDNVAQLGTQLAASLAARTVRTHAAAEPLAPPQEESGRRTQKGSVG